MRAVYIMNLFGILIFLISCSNDTEQLEFKKARLEKDTKEIEEKLSILDIELDSLYAFPEIATPKPKDNGAEEEND